MKYLLMLLFTILLLGCDNNQRTSQKSTILQSNMDEEYPILSFAIKEIDLGTVGKNKKEFIPVSFEFTNTGIKPLVIKKIDVSCGCVEVDYVKSPIVKGRNSEVKVKLDIRGLTGYFHKKISIITNAENDYEELLIKGHVVENL